jgi:hypothetical protein
MSESQKKYFKSSKGQKALKKARDAYDKRDPDRRRKQKRDYMRRVRQKQKLIDLGYSLEDLERDNPFTQHGEQQERA